MEGDKILDEIERSQLRKPVIAECFRKCGFDWAQDLISDHLEQATLEEEVERLAMDDESSDDGLGGSNEDDSE